MKRPCTIIVVMAIWCLFWAGSEVPADEIFFEPFDEGLGDWNVIHPHFSTDDGTLRGSGDGQRGAMFRAAPSVAEMEFAFLRQQNDPPNFAVGDQIEIALTPGEVLDGQALTGPRLRFTDQANFPPPGNPDTLGYVAFFVHGNSNEVLSSWNLFGQIADNTWYDGLMLIEDDSTVTFGYRAQGEANYLLSTGHPLPPTFVPTHVGVTGYKVPNAGAGYGTVALDDVRAATTPSHPALSFYYPFDGNALDVAGGHHGTLIGDATFSTDTPPHLGGGQSLELDGTLDKMIYDATAADLVSGSFTIAAWVNALERRPGATLTFVGTRSPEQHGVDFKYIADERIRLDIGDGANWLTISDTAVSYELDEWHHVAVTVEEGEYGLYYDGELLRTVPMAAGVPLLLDGDHDLAIGAINALLVPNGPPLGEDFHGRIDDVRIYNTVLSANEVQLAKVGYNSLPVLGDLDLDGDVDFDDIDDFVLGLTNMPAYEALHGLPSSVLGDTDGDGDHDFDDIDEFVDTLTSGNVRSDPQGVPEPSSLCLAALGLSGYVGRRLLPRKRRVLPNGTCSGTITAGNLSAVSREVSLFA